MLRTAESRTLTLFRPVFQQDKVHATSLRFIQMAQLNFERSSHPRVEPWKKQGKANAMPYLSDGCWVPLVFADHMDTCRPLHSTAIGAYYLSARSFVLTVLWIRPIKIHFPNCEKSQVFQNTHTRCRFLVYPVPIAASSTENFFFFSIPPGTRSIKPIGGQGLSIPDEGWRVYSVGFYAAYCSIRVSWWENLQTKGSRKTISFLFLSPFFSARCFCPACESPG